MIDYIMNILISKFSPQRVANLAKFEYLSKKGRKKAKPLYLNSNKNYINLGSGNVYIENFINIDFFTNKGADYHLDMRYPFLIEDNSIDGIFTDHTLEHFDYKELDLILSEAFRILKNNSTIRIIVPNMSLFIKKYYENDKEWFDNWKDTILGVESRKHLHKYFSPIFALNFTSNYYYHKTSWDFSMAKKLLERHGFSNIKEYKFMEGTKELLKDKEGADRKMISLYIEANKI